MITIVAPQGSRSGLAPLLREAPGASLLLLPAADPPPASGRAVGAVLAALRTPYFLKVDGAGVVPSPGAVGRLLQAARDTQAGMVYGDYRRLTTGGAAIPHPLTDYQTGSLRDTFDFGPLVLFSTEAVREALSLHGAVPAGLRHAGWYDLRLKLSLKGGIFHLRECLAAVAEGPGPSAHFAYVDPAFRDRQREMEEVATDHLRRLGACLEGDFAPVPPDGDVFPVEASVVIPVRDRAATIGEAVRSALGQEADFPFNVLVVDNHSTDGTTDLLRGIADGRLVHLVPNERGLGIGGCWNEAIFSPFCGRYAVQLDSDDLYAGPDTLRRLVEVLREGDCAMVVGSYTVVDASLNVIPPGLVDHREWTDRNGRNNALRVEGFGAPRAYRTGVLRRIRFPDVSYGEDYAVALRICRDYRIGRIYESLYLCRRWEGNTDAAPSPETLYRYNAYKDMVRTMEIEARKRKNSPGGGREGRV